MKLCIGLGLSQNRGGGAAPVGPTITAPGSIDVSTFKIGTTQTITAGTATATGGGSVTYEVRHLSNGEVKSTLAGYAHVAADDTETGTAQWRAVESGGSNDGATSWQTVASGTITYPAPSNTVAPSVSGSTGLGDILSVTQGTWTGGGIAYSYQWQRNGSDISGATASSYMIVTADDAASIRCVVTATNSGGAVSANSNAVTVDDFAAPSITGSPTISGTETQGSILTASPASVTGNPTPSRSWQWERNGSPISGATSATYTLQVADVGATLTVVQSETNALGGDSAESAATGVISAAATAPDAFVDANWSVATGSGPSELDITVSALPANNGAAITNVQYDVDGSGTWLNLPSYAGTGAYTVTMAATSTSYGIRLRAVNSAGNGAAGNTESATSGAGAATVPSAFVDADWSVAAGSDHKDLDITIATLPNNGGSAITDIEYDVDASGTWVSLGTATTGTTTVTMAAGNTSYAIRLRAVNAVGNASPGNSESATSAALAITGYSFNGTDTISFSLNGTGTLHTSTTAATETDAADIENGVGAIDTDTDVLSSGSNNITVSYPNTFDDNWLNLVVKSGSEYSNVISNQYTFGDIVPRAFVDANWSVATGSGSAELDITIASLPSNGGATITDVEYDVDASGTWISLGATSGTTTVTMAAASTSYAIRLRAVNSVGNGLTGNSESATSGSAAATAPSAFVDANWSVATGSGANELDITIASLPANGGATITDVEYDVDGGGSWTSLAATSGTITVTMAAASTSYDIRLRAVNSVGSGAAGNTESATSGASAGNPELLPDAGIDNAGKWVVPGGVTIQNGAAELRSPAQWSTIYSVENTADMAPVSANTAYTWGATIANFTSGGSAQALIWWYDSGGTYIDQSGAMAITISANGSITADAPASPANSAYAVWAFKAAATGFDFDITDASIKAT